MLQECEPVLVVMASRHAVRIFEKVPGLSGGRLAARPALPLSYGSCLQMMLACTLLLPSPRSHPRHRLPLFSCQRYGARCMKRTSPFARG